MNTILAVGRVVGGSVHLHVTPPALLVPVVEVMPWEPVEEQPKPQDGALQKLIDYGAELAEYEDDMIDRLFWSRGAW